MQAEQNVKAGGAAIVAATLQVGRFCKAQPKPPPKKVFG